MFGRTFLNSNVPSYPTETEMTLVAAPKKDKSFLRYRVYLKEGAPQTTLCENYGLPSTKLTPSTAMTIPPPPPTTPRYFLVTPYYLSCQLLLTPGKYIFTCAC